MKNDDAPADQERKLGIVNSETITNCTKVMRGPAAGSSLYRIRVRVRVVEDG